MKRPRVMLNALYKSAKACEMISQWTVVSEDETTLNCFNECMDFCELSVKLLLRNSANIPDVMVITINLLDACLNECYFMYMDDRDMSIDIELTDIIEIFERCLKLAKNAFVRYDDLPFC